MNICADKTDPTLLPSFILPQGRTRPVHARTLYKWVTTYDAYYCRHEHEPLWAVTVSVKIDPKHPTKRTIKKQHKNTWKIFDQNPVVPPRKKNAPTYNVMNTGPTNIMGRRGNRKRETRGKHEPQCLFLSLSLSSKKHLITGLAKGHIYTVIIHTSISLRSLPATRTDIEKPATPKKYTFCNLSPRPPPAPPNIS